MVSQVQGARSKAGAVKARGASRPKKTGRGFGDAGGVEEVVDVEDARGLGLAISSGSGALVQVRHIRRWRARKVGVGGGFIVQFWYGEHTISSSQDGHIYSTDNRSTALALADHVSRAASHLTRRQLERRLGRAPGRPVSILIDAM
jgi:hypothetical protein